MDLFICLNDMDLTYIAEVGDLSSQTMDVISRESKCFQTLTALSTLLSCIVLWRSLPLSIVYIRKL